MLHEQAAPAVSSLPSSFAAQSFPTSVLLQENRDEYRPLLHMHKEDKTSQVQILLAHVKLVSLKKHIIGYFLSFFSRSF